MSVDGQFLENKAISSASYLTIVGIRSGQQPGCWPLSHLAKWRIGMLLSTTVNKSANIGSGDSLPTPKVVLSCEPEVLHLCDTCLSANW